MQNTPLSSVQAPVLMDFLEVTDFLKAYYQFRKTRQTGFSFATWAQELGLKSRSFLRLVLIGKRSLTEDVAQLLVQNLKLNKNESAYFLHLVGLQRASQIQAREYHSREIAKLRHKFQLKKHSLIEVAQKDLFDFLSSYHIPRLQVLLTLNEVDKTPSSLAKLLGIKESEVQQHLKTLQNLGLAKVTTEHQWQAVENQIGTPDSLGHVALQSFHKKSLEEAIQALSWPKESRRYQSLVMALTQEQFESLHQDLRQTLEACLEKFKTESNKTKKVYQINLSLIPVTGPIDRPQKGETVASAPTQKEEPL